MPAGAPIGSVTIGLERNLSDPMGTSQRLGLCKIMVVCVCVCVCVCTTVPNHMSSSFNIVDMNAPWLLNGRFTHNMPFPCRAHAVPLPCIAAKGLECVFTI